MKLAADTNLGIFQLVCTHKHDSSKKVSSCNHFALLDNHTSKSSRISDRPGHQASANTALMQIATDNVFMDEIYCVTLCCLCLLIKHFVLRPNFAVLQNPWYLHIATMYNQTQIVEYCLSLGMNAAETDNVRVFADLPQSLAH